MFPQQVTRSYDPPPVPRQFSTHNTPLHSPQRGFSNINIIQHVLFTQSQQPILRKLPYTPAQTSNIQHSTFTINTIQTNPQSHQTTTRTLSRPPSSPILNNPLSYKLSSTNINNIQQPSTPQNNTLQMNSVSTSQIPQIPSTTIRTSPHIHATTTSSASSVNYHTILSSTLPTPT